MNQVIQGRTMGNEVLQPEIAQRLKRGSVYRDRINQRLDRTREQINTALPRFEPRAAPAVAHLALLEGLLATRRDALAELIELDEKFVDYLLALKTDACDERRNGKPLSEVEPRVDAQVSHFALAARTIHMQG